MGIDGYGHRGLLANLFGLKLVSDIPERLCELGVRPLLDAKRRRRIEAIRRAGKLMIHVPKAGGMSCSQALYGLQVKHVSIRYYQVAAPELARELPSFAFIRDPVERFCSAYAYAKAGGGSDNRVSRPFRERYMAFRDVDEALDHLEDGADNPYAVDHIFRPQHWYVTNAWGAVAVRDLLPFEAIGKVTGITRLNGGVGEKPRLSEPQRARLRRLYRADFQLYEAAASA